MISLFMATLLAAHLGPTVPGEPLRQPQIAVSGHTVALVFGAGNAIYFSGSRDSGGNFSKPVKVDGANDDGVSKWATTATGSVVFESSNELV